MSVTLHEAAPDGLAYVESLLDAEGLPTRDLQAKPGCFFVATAGGERVGVGGVEVHGAEGLLRSVVVAEDHRGQGHGTALCDELEAHARTAGIERLYALTTTAAGFFRRRGYDVCDGGSVPVQIRETAEFSELCPSTASCLRKRL